MLNPFDVHLMIEAKADARQAVADVVPEVRGQARLALQAPRCATGSSRPDAGL